MNAIRSLLRLSAVALVPALFLTGCVPILPRSVFRPIAPGGTVGGYKYQPKTTISFPRDGVLISAHIFPTAGDRWTLAMQFAVPEGKTVVLVGSELRLQTDERVWQCAFAGLSYSGNPAMPVLRIVPLVGENMKVNGVPTGLSRNYWLYASLQLAGVSRVRVLLPPFQINGRKVTLPEILFTHDIDIRLMAPIQS